MILLREIKDAEKSSFSSDFQILILKTLISFIFSLLIIDEFAK